MKFFDDIKKHPKKFKKEFNKKITPKVIKNAYKAGLQGAKQEKKLNEGGFYILSSNNNNKKRLSSTRKAKAMKSTKCILRLNKKDNHLYLQLPNTVKANGFQDKESLHLITRNHGREFEVIGTTSSKVLHLKATITENN